MSASVSSACRPPGHAAGRSRPSRGVSVDPRIMSPSRTALRPSISGGCAGGDTPPPSTPAAGQVAASSRCSIPGFLAASHLLSFLPGNRNTCSTTERDYQTCHANSVHPSENTRSPAIFTAVKLASSRSQGPPFSFVGSHLLPFRESFRLRDTTCPYQREGLVDDV